MNLNKPKRHTDSNILKHIRSKPCCVCGDKENIDASHIKTRGSGGPDTEWNVVPHCRTHHIEWGQYGITKFLNRYPMFFYALKARGWEVNEENGLTSLWHPGLSPAQSPQQG